MRRTPRGGKNLLQFRWHVQRDDVVDVGLEISNVGPEADQQESISDLQPLLEQSVRDHFAAMPQSDDREAVFGANAGFKHCLANQLGFGGQDDLRRTNLLRKIDEVVAGLAERKRLKLQ